MNGNETGRKSHGKISVKNQAKIDSITAKIRAKQQEQEVKLPEWGQLVRGTPNALLRSALFTIDQSKNREYYEEKVVFSQRDITIKYTGKRLNQEDLTVWETLVHLAKDSPLGTNCTFSARHILKTMDMSPGGDQQKRVHKSLLRLTACVVTIKHNGYLYNEHLIESSVQEEITKHYTILLNRKLILLYGATQYTNVNWEQRRKLRGKPLAQKLHGYYSSHREPHPVKVGTLQKLADSHNKDPDDVKRKIKNALKNLEDIGFLKSFDIDGDLVSVVRTPTLPRDM